MVAVAFASGDFGPAPPDVDLSENQTASILSSVIAIMVLGILAVLLRLVARMVKTGVGLAIDDYCIIAALVFAIGTAACCIISIPYGGGQHLWVLTFDDFNSLWKTTYAFVLIYATTVSLTKGSILLFYRRIFGVNLAYWVCMGLVVSYWVAIVIAWFTGCRPASYFWEQFTNPEAEGVCMNTSLFYFVNGICAMLIDISILIVPIPTIIALRMPPGQKLAVMAILLLGAFVCVASVVRIIFMDRLVKAEDFTWAMSQVFIWSCCEPFVGIVCACLPTYAPLFKHWWKSVAGSRSDGAGKDTNDHDKYGTHSKGSTPGFLSSKASRNWSRLGGEKLKLRSDDEVELANDIRGGRKTDGSYRSKDSDDEVVYKGGIKVESSVVQTSESFYH